MKLLSKVILLFLITTTVICAAGETRIIGEEIPPASPKQNTAEPSPNKPIKEDKEPISVTNEKKDGQGTVLEYTVSKGKEFYTIETVDKSTYYLIIDNDKSEKNVYFLTTINDENLLVKNKQFKNPFEQKEKEKPIQEVVTPEPTKEKGNSSWILIAIVVLIVGGIGYYFKIVKPKKEQKQENVEEYFPPFDDEPYYESETDELEELDETDELEDLSYNPDEE